MLDKIYDYWVITSSVVTIASILAAATPTKKDDAVMAKVRAFIDMIALNIFNAKTKD